MWPRICKALDREDMISDIVHAELQDAENPRLSREEQIARAEILLDRQGWEAWPACSRQLGLR